MSIGSLFKQPKVPAIAPPPPPPPPTLTMPQAEAEDAAAQATGRARAKRSAALRTGQRSTILTSALGTTGTATQKKTLLGQ